MPLQWILWSMFNYQAVNPSKICLAHTLRKLHTQTIHLEDSEALWSAVHNGEKYYSYAPNITTINCFQMDVAKGGTQLQCNCWEIEKYKEKKKSAETCRKYIHYKNWFSYCCVHRHLFWPPQSPNSKVLRHREPIHPNISILTTCMQAADVYTLDLPNTQ